MGRERHDFGKAVAASLHFVAQSPWDGDALLRRVRAAVLPAMTARGAVEAWIVDDMGFPREATIGSAAEEAGFGSASGRSRVTV